MTDAEKAELLRVSLLNIGRMLPPGVEISFYYVEDNSYPHMEICYPDGKCTLAKFTSHSPVFKIPEMQP